MELRKMSEDKHTYDSGYDQDWVYRIYHYMNGARVDSISAADSKEKLEHALKYWAVTFDDRERIIRWLGSMLIKAESDAAFDYRKTALRRSSLGRNKKLRTR